MNKIISFVKKYLGESMTITGTGILIYNIFNFSYITSIKGSLPVLPKLGKEMIQGVAYYYSNNTIILITIGAMLIVFGIITMKHKKQIYENI